MRPVQLTLLTGTTTDISLSDTISLAQLGVHLTATVKKLALALAICAALLAQADAQTIRGRVVDPSGAPITGATVSVNPGASRSTTTSATGSFEITNVATPALVTVHAAGFTDATATWNGADLSFTLAPAPLSQQLVVTATRTEAPLAEVAASVSFLSANETADSPSLLLDDLLREVPGFSLFRRTSSRAANPTAQGVSLRGLGASGASRALVLYNAVPLNDPFGGWVYWDRVVETDVREVEVLRGAGSPLYGSGALAGVIAIQPSESQRSDLSLDLSGGELGTANASGTATAALGRWNLSASAQGLKTDGYIPVPRPLRGTADAPANVRFGTGRLTVDRHFSSATVFVSENLFNESRQNGTALQTNSTRLAETIAGADAAVAGGALSVRAFGSGEHFNQTFSSISLDRNTESLVRVQVVPAQQFGTSVLWNRELSSWNTVAIGTDFRRVTGHSDEEPWARNIPTGRVNSGGRQMYFGGFVEDMLRLGSRLNVTAAMRGDWWRNYDALSTSLSFATGSAQTTTRFADKSRGSFSPSLGAVLRLSKMVSLSASAYGAFRAPTLNELYRGFRLGNVLTNANDSLRPERLRGAETGVTLGSGAVLARATYFWNTIHDAVGNRTLSTTPALITRQRQNIGDIVSQGLEFELQTRLPRHLWTRTSYEYAHAVVTRSLEPGLLDLRVPQVPRHSVAQVLGYDAKWWSGNVVGRYVGRQFDDDLNQFVLPGFFTADLMLRVRAIRSIEPYIAAENLFDRDYYVGRTPTPTLGSPRLVRAGLRFRIGPDRVTP